MCLPIHSPSKYKRWCLFLYVLAFFNVSIAQTTKPVLPNIFTPNGDAINDEFFIDTNEIPIKSFSLKIYNRMGVLLFSSSTEKIGWDGRTNSGVKVPEGVYFYTVEINGQKYKNTLMLVY